MRAKYNVYRNLHKQLFSIRYRGLIIAHETTAVLSGCIFTVKSRHRNLVRKTLRKNVHAWIACESFEVVKNIDISKLEEIYYCPYTVDFFCYRECLKIYCKFVEILEAEKVYCINNKIYVGKVLD
jgi:hypothetical protein